MLKIAIDAGHGLYTSGKRCMKSIDKNETREWYLNDRIADKLESLLKKYDCKVLRVDDTTGNKDVSLSNRCKAANNFDADVYISIHHNAGVGGGNGGGTQVYYYSAKAERVTQAKDLYNCIVNNTGLIGNRSEKVIYKGFHVLKHTDMAAFLIENGFMDSKADVPIILKDSHAEGTAHGIVDFLLKDFGLKLAANTPVKNVSGEKIKVGDNVTVLNNITYDGKSFKTWHKTYKVISLVNDRAVIGVNGVVTAAINIKNIKKV